MKNFWLVSEIHGSAAAKQKKVAPVAVKKTDNNMCQDRVIKLLIFGFIVGLLLPECHASPHPASSISKERPADDYDYDDEDEPSREMKPENDINNGLSQTQLLVKNHTIEAELDETVTLPCRIQHPESNTIIMWYNMTQMLYMRNNSLVQDPRVSLEPDYSVKIRNVQATDDSIYKCTVLPIRKSVFITLKVKSPPYNVRITHGNKNYAGEELELQERDRKFVLHCEASGYPTPSITWSFRGKHLDEAYAKHSDITIRKEFLEIHDVKGHHTGDYECLAQNGIGVPVSAVVAVQIKSSPVIVKHVEYINTAIGENTEVVCLYRSYPEARKIQWYRGDELLYNNAKFTITNDRHNHHERTRLSVQNVEQKDLVDYRCRIENSLGESSAKSILGLLPGSAHLVHSNYSNGQLHTSWRVRSAQPLSELQILYKRVEGPKYITIEPTLSELNKEEPGDMWSVRRSLKLPAGEWLITARSKNTEGWAYAETVPFKFQIPSEVSLDQSQHGSGAQQQMRSLGLGFCLLLFSLLCRLF